MLVIALALAVASPRSLRAQATETLAQDRPPPADVSAADLLRSMPSDVRIIARENHDIEEYRSGNNLYMVKVKPRNAPPYYLIDQDGSGELQWRRGSELESTVVPQWAIVRW